jgi:hypothetical protein
MIFVISVIFTIRTDVPTSERRVTRSAWPNPQPGPMTAFDRALSEAARLTRRRTRHAKRPFVYALVATLSVALLAASALDLLVRGGVP